jgi:hypothetical protein
MSLKLLLIGAVIVLGVVVIATVLFIAGRSGRE